MAKLTLEAAQEFHNRCMLRISDVSFRKIIENHSVNVGELAILLSKNHSDDVFFRIAGLVHDIGICVDNENHAAHSLNLLRQEGFEISFELEDCILNHGSRSITKTSQGKLFQLADKLSIFDLGLVSRWLNGFEDPFSKEFLLLLHRKVSKLDILF